MFSTCPSVCVCGHAGRGILQLSCHRLLVGSISGGTDPTWKSCEEEMCCVHDCFSLQFLNISDGVTSTPSRCLKDDPLLSVVLDTPSVNKNTARWHSLCLLARICVCCYRGRYSWHSAGSRRWPFPVLKHKYMQPDSRTLFAVTFYCSAASYGLAFEL